MDLPVIWEHILYYIADAAGYWHDSMVSLRWLFEHYKVNTFMVRLFHLNAMEVNTNVVNSVFERENWNGVTIFYYFIFCAMMSVMGKWRGLRLH